MTDQKLKIKIWLLKNGITQSQIAREVCLSIGHVSRVFKGSRWNKRVADALVKRGCPPEYFNQKRKES